jgi:hypothetical protein
LVLSSERYSFCINLLHARKASKRSSLLSCLLLITWTDLSGRQKAVGKIG